jgi:hypothetical protein
MVKMRVPDDALERIDNEASRRGITRTALLLEGWLKTSTPAPVIVPESTATAAPAFSCPLHPGADGIIGKRGFFCDECRRLYGSGLAYARTVAP